MNPFNLIPVQYRYLIEAVAFAVVVGAIAWLVISFGQSKFAAGKVEGDAAGYSRGHAEAVKIREDWDREKIEHQQAALAAQEAERVKQAAIVAENERVTRDSAQIQYRLSRERDAAVRAADGLREQIAAILAAAGGGQVGPGSGPAADGSPATAFGRLLATCASRYQELAADADADHAAGAECERRYDALTSSEPQDGQ